MQDYVEEQKKPASSPEEMLEVTADPAPHRPGVKAVGRQRPGPPGKQVYVRTPQPQLQ